MVALKLPQAMLDWIAEEAQRQGVPTSVVIRDRLMAGILLAEPDKSRLNYTGENSR